MAGWFGLGSSLFVWLGLFCNQGGNFAEDWNLSPKYSVVQLFFKVHLCEQRHCLGLGYS